MFHATIALLPRHCVFFFLMIRRPPRSTLFPSRRSSDLTMRVSMMACLVSASANKFRQYVARPSASAWANTFTTGTRSEEHTSELQSHSDLVCRLLLDKKNQ